MISRNLYRVVSSLALTTLAGCTESATSSAAVTGTAFSIDVAALTNSSALRAGAQAQIIFSYQSQAAVQILATTTEAVTRGQRTLSLSVDIAPCLRDPGRFPFRANACPLRISIVLRDETGSRTDSTQTPVIFVEPGVAPAPVTATVREVAEVRLVGFTRDTLLVRDSLQLSAQAYSANGVRMPERDVDVRWSSTDSATAVVTPTGMLRTFRRSLGGATLSANIGGRTMTRRVVVVGVQSVNISKTSSIISLGQTDSLAGSATVDPGVTPGVRWMSSNLNVATISANGVLTPVSQGTTQVQLVALGDTLQRRTADIAISGDCRPAPTPLALNTTINGTVSLGDCLNALSPSDITNKLRGDRFAVTLTQQTIFGVGVSTAFSPGLSIGGFDYFVGDFQVVSYAIFPAGTYNVSLFANTNNAQTTGSYGLQTTTAVSASTCPAFTSVARGVDFTWQLSATCADFGVQGASIRTRAQLFSVFPRTDNAPLQVSLRDVTSRVVVELRRRPSGFILLPGDLESAPLLARAIAAPNQPAVLNYTPISVGEIVYLIIADETAKSTSTNYRVVINP